MNRQDLQQVGFSIEETSAGFRVRHPELNPSGPFDTEVAAWGVAGALAGLISQEIPEALAEEPGAVETPVTPAPKRVRRKRQR